MININIITFAASLSKRRRYHGRWHLSVFLSFCVSLPDSVPHQCRRTARRIALQPQLHACRCPPSRDCRRVALVSAAKVMRCIQCSLAIIIEIRQRANVQCMKYQIIHGIYAGLVTLSDYHPIGSPSVSCMENFSAGCTQQEVKRSVSSCKSSLPNQIHVKFNQTNWKCLQKTGMYMECHMQELLTHLQQLLRCTVCTATV